MIGEIRPHRNAMPRTGEFTYIAMDTVLRVADLGLLERHVPGKNIDKTGLVTFQAPGAVFEIYRYRIHLNPLNLLINKHSAP